jgi:hypothetical protein
MSRSPRILWKIGAWTFAGLLATTGCGDPLEGSLSRPKDAPPFNPARPLGGEDPKPSRNSLAAKNAKKKDGAPIFVPKNPKLRD